MVLVAGAREVPAGLGTNRQRTLCVCILTLTSAPTRCIHVLVEQNTSVIISMSERGAREGQYGGNCAHGVIPFPLADLAACLFACV